MRMLWKFSRKFSTFYESGSSTIYALATGGIRSALAVVRVSGPNSTQVLSKLGQLDASRLPLARQATLRKLYDPISSDLLDHAILLWFPGPNSYTGEDCCEFHIHGGAAVITGVLKAIGNVEGCRMAQPGEFTKRAFLNGKMDLTEVDGLADLISAETEMQRVQALKQMSGSLSKVYESWRDRIAKCLANCEAYIDFGEEESLESEVMDSVEKEVDLLISDVQLHLKDEGRGEKLRNGLRVAILGKPNVGKSTLLNLLCKREAAIVSSIPGTTRDVIESCVNLYGFPVIFIDTAGIRSHTQDQIEAEGIRRSIGQIESADLIILLFDPSQLQSEQVVVTDKSWKREFIQRQLNLHDDQAGVAGEGNEGEMLCSLEEKTIVVMNKVDLISEKSVDGFECAISCKTSKGIQHFHEILENRIKLLCGDVGADAPNVTRQRYRSELESCLSSLQQFQHHSHSQDFALRTNHLKNAIYSIGNITGHVHSEQILDIIFRDFCIGK